MERLFHRNSGSIAAGILVTILLGAVGCGGSSDEVVSAETANRRWAEQRKAEILEERVRSNAKMRESARRAKRAREDQDYEANEKAEAARRKKTLAASAAMERRIESLGAASERQEDELRSFALLESPKIWQTIQYLRAEMELQDNEIERLKKTCRERDVPYRDTPEFVRLCRLRNKLVRSLRIVEDKLVEALVAQRQYRATPLRSEFERSMRKALEDGVVEAGLIQRQYEEMKNER